MLARICCQRFKIFAVESVRKDPGVDDRAYKIQIISTKILKDRPVLQTEKEETTHVLADPQWKDGIRSVSGGL